ncbi:MAG TPA: hypothetical protein VED41_13925, partial [Solirubrobacteraceae bacterium]|nr:hypothetical protein [Solirubrobacteraceae bacterium]
VEAIACSGDDPALVQRLLSEAMARWLDAGHLFALLPLEGEGGGTVLAAARAVGGAELPRVGPATGNGALAMLRLDDPLVLVWDMEGVLQPPFVSAPAVVGALAEGRRAMARFFVELTPGDALLHLNEDVLKRRVAEWAATLFGASGPGRRRIVLGLGRLFSRDIVGNAPTIAIELERCLTWQGYEGGLFPLHGSAPLELQLAVVRELGREAILLAPFLDSAEAVIQTVTTAREVGVHVGEVLIGVTSASVSAALELRGIGHRCLALVPRWQGVMRESAVAPYLGGWSIVGRAPLEAGSLLPSLPDCLPYHYPHHLGLSGPAALDFSRVALHHARRLLHAIEETFREREGRLLSVRDLGAVVRIPRCPPLPEGFLPPRERIPSELLAEDIEALARLHPETHAAHRERWSDV